MKAGNRGYINTVKTLNKIQVYHTLFHLIGGKGSRHIKLSEIISMCLCVSPSAASRQRSHLGLILPPEDAGPCLGMTVFVKTGAAPGVERVGARHAAPHPTTPGTDSNVSSAKGGTPAL